MTVLCPVGKSAQSTVAESLGQFAGHILHLVPGDYQYEPPQFTVVIGWNQVDHFWPTELAHPQQVYEWKLALCHQYLNGAVQMYNETESQIEEEEDTLLLDSLQTLRNQMEVTRQLLLQRVKSKEVTVPPITVLAQKKTAMTKELEVDYQPVPLIRHQVKEKNPDVFPAKTTGGPEQQAPRKLFPPILMGPALLKEQFSIPKEVVQSTQPSKQPSRKRQAKEPEVEEVPSSKRATRSAAKSSSSGPPSVKVSIPLSSLQPASSSVAPSASPKKFVCNQCDYTTDRKHDFDNHSNQHSGIKYICDTCKKTFYSEAARKKHIQTTHLQLKMARCSQVDCNWEDKDFGKKKVHEYDAHGIGQPAKCNVCGRKFDNWRSFTRHQTTCGREKNKKCPECKKQYKDLERLTKHMEEAHQGKGYSPQVCDKCGKILRNKDSLRAHKSANCN